MMIPKKTIVEIMARAVVQTLSGRPGWRRFFDSLGPPGGRLNDGHVCEFSVGVKLWHELGHVNQLHISLLITTDAHTLCVARKSSPFCLFLNRIFNGRTRPPYIRTY